MPESQKENPLAGFRKGFDPDGDDERRARAASGAGSVVPRAAGLISGNRGSKVPTGAVELDRNGRRRPPTVSGIGGEALQTSLSMVTRRGRVGKRRARLVVPAAGDLAGWRPPPGAPQTLAPGATIPLLAQPTPRRQRGRRQAQRVGGVLEDRVGDRRHQQRQQQAER